MAAGDLLVFKCPTWSWEKASDPSKVIDYLPVDKQFLITRKGVYTVLCSLIFLVPCKQRFHDEGAKGGAMVEDDEWLAVEAAETAFEEAAQEIPDIEDKNKPAEVDVGGDEDDIPDMDEFDEDDNLVEEDPVGSLFRLFSHCYRLPLKATQSSRPGPTTLVLPTTNITRPLRFGFLVTPRPRDL